MMSTGHWPSRASSRGRTGHGRSTWRRTPHTEKQSAVLHQYRASLRHLLVSLVERSHGRRRRTYHTLVQRSPQRRLRLVGQVRGCRDLRSAGDSQRRGHQARPRPDLRSVSHRHQPAEPCRARDQSISLRVRVDPFHLLAWVAFQRLEPCLGSYRLFRRRRRRPSRRHQPVVRCRGRMGMSPPVPDRSIRSRSLPRSRHSHREEPSLGSFHSSR